MTKEELSVKIAQCDYRDCKLNGNFSVSFKIDNESATATKIGDSIVAMVFISTNISEDDYNEILKKALRNELESVKAHENELTERINAL